MQSVTGKGQYGGGNGERKRGNITDKKSKMETANGRINSHKGTGINTFQVVSEITFLVLVSEIT